MNSTSTKTSVDSIESSANQPVTWIIVDILFFIYCLIMLILILKKHRNHLEPVHLLTLSGLVDIVTVCFIYFIFDLVCHSYGQKQDTVSPISTDFLPSQSGLVSIWMSWLRK